MFKTLVFRKLFVLLLLLILTVLEVEVNTISCSVKFKLFVKDMERYVLFISILLCYVVGLPTLAIGKLYTSTLEWIFSTPVFSA